MNSIDRSILQQKAKKTYNRNQYIRFLFRSEKNMAELGRQFNISRQTIRKILQEGYEQKVSDNIC